MCIHHLDAWCRPDVLRVRHHISAEAVHDKNLGGRSFSRNQLIEHLDDVVHVGRHHLPNFGARTDPSRL